MTTRDYVRAGLVTAIAYLGGLITGLQDDALTTAEHLTAAVAGLSALAAALGISAKPRRRRRSVR